MIQPLHDRDARRLQSRRSALSFGRFLIFCRVNRWMAQRYADAARICARPNGRWAKGARQNVYISHIPTPVLMGHNLQNEWLRQSVEFAGGVYPGRRFHRLTGRRIFVLHGSVPRTLSRAAPRRRTTPANPEAERRSARKLRPRRFKSHRTSIQQDKSGQAPSPRNRVPSAAAPILRRPLHDDEAGALQMLNQPPGDDLRQHYLAGAPDCLIIALEDARIGMT